MMTLSRNMLVVLFLFLFHQGVYAVDVSFSAGGYGGTVGLKDSYQASNDINVEEKAVASFNGNLGMTNTRRVSGSGDTEMHQQLYGKEPGYYGYSTYNLLRTRGAKGLNDKTNSKIYPISADVLRNTIIENSDIAETALYGCRNGGYAGVNSRIEDGNLTANQRLVVDRNIKASQEVEMRGQLGHTHAESGYDDGLLARTESNFKKGNLSSKSKAIFDCINARASQDTSMVAEVGSAGSRARSHDGDMALAETGMKNGSLTTTQKVFAGESAAIFERSNLIADFGYTMGLAEDADGNRVEIYDEANMSEGTFDTVKGLKADDGVAVILNDLNVTRALTALALSSARTSEGDEAYTNVTAKMAEGEFNTTQWLKAKNGTATILHDATATKANEGFASSYGKASDGDKAKTNASATMTEGNFTTDIALQANGGVAIIHDTNATRANTGSATSYAKDSDGNKGKTSASATMTEGNFTSDIALKADDGVAIVHDTNATKANTGSATSYAKDSDGNKGKTNAFATMTEGNFTSDIALIADDGVAIIHDTKATKANTGSATAYAVGSEGNEGKTDVATTMAEGQFDTLMNLEADGDAAIYQKTNATKAITGSAFSRASNSDGDRGNTSVTASMNQGTFNNTLKVDALDENVSIYHKADATQALKATSHAFAEDESGNLANTSVSATMNDGIFDTIINLEADGSASILQNANATLATSGQALTLGLSQEGDLANTNVSATMDSGYFNNTLRVRAQDDRVSDYHQFNATEVLTSKKSGQVKDNLGNNSSVSAVLIMDHGPIDGVMDLYVEEGAEIYQYLKADKVLWGTDGAHSEDASSHKADSSLTITDGMFSNEIVARAMSNATIDHGFYARADLILANVSGGRPGEQSRINTTVYPNRNNIKPATLQGLQTADSNSTGTEANQYIQARGFINSEVRSSSDGLTSNSDLNYDSVGVDTHLWAATNSTHANSDRWTIFYLDDDVGNETIQSSVDEAFDHPTTEIPTRYDTIRVFEGVYREHNIAVDKSLYIIGNGTDKTIVDGEMKGRVFEIGLVNPSKDVFLEYMKIWNGTAPTDFFGDARGGAIYNSANLTLIGVDVTGSTAKGASSSGQGGNAYGGGIYSDNNLTLIETNVYDNQAIGGDAGPSNNPSKGGSAYGGGIYNENNLTLIASHIYDNQAIGGGAVGKNIQGVNGNDANSGNTPPDASNDVTFYFKSGSSSQYTYNAGEFDHDKIYSKSYLAGFIKNQVDQYNEGRPADKKLILPRDNITFYHDGTPISWGGSGWNEVAYNAGYAASSGSSYWGADFYNLTANYILTITLTSNTASSGSDGGDATGMSTEGTSATGFEAIGGDAYGGGIYSTSQLTLIDSIVDTNLAKGGDGIGGDGIGGLGGNGGDAGDGSDAGFGFFSWRRWQVRRRRQCGQYRRSWHWWRWIWRKCLRRRHLW